MYLKYVPHCLGWPLLYLLLLININPRSFCIWVLSNAEKLSLKWANLLIFNAEFTEIFCPLAEYLCKLNRASNLIMLLICKLRECIAA